MKTLRLARGEALSEEALSEKALERTDRTARLAEATGRKNS